MAIRLCNSRRFVNTSLLFLPVALSWLRFLNASLAGNHTGEEMSSCKVELLNLSGTGRTTHVGFVLQLVRLV
jgi:hypothetical protein